MDNMDWIIIIVKNWPNDPRANFKQIQTSNNTWKHKNF